VRLGGPFDCFLHLGDYGSDGETIAAILGVPGHMVRGNCDFSSRYEKEKVVTLEGASLLLLHGDGVRDVTQLAYKGEERHCKAVLFGHTHQPLLTASGPILILNPGSLSRPRFGWQPSFAVLTIDHGDINARLYPIETNA
jgi:putative phosphoesterase